MAVVLRDQGDLRVQLLFRNRVVGDSAFITFQIELGVVEQSLIARERGFGKIQCGLIGARVDFEKHLTLFDQIPFVEIHLH